MNREVKKAPEPVVVFGFGAQGSAQAQNIRDNKRQVSVFLNAASPRAHAVKEAGLLLLTDAKKAAAEAVIASLLISDGKQPAFYKEHLETSLPKGALLVFAHGYAIHYKLIIPRPDLDVVLVAPLAQGETLRNDHVSGASTPCVIAVHQDATGRAKERALDYANLISLRGPFIDSTFAEEVESDLFVEQAVLCGGMPELVRAAFETLIEAGCNEEIAYFSCLKELRAIVNLMDKHGIAGMRERISDTALYGAVTRGPRIIDGHVRKSLKKTLGDIRSGAFAKELALERQDGSKRSNEELKKDREHSIEIVHEKFK